jgi:histidinol-phosphatase (PHP family)
VQLNDHPNAESLVRLMDKFYLEATRLKAKYSSEITLLIGFESEWIRPSSLDLIHGIQKKYQWDMFVGSVHHVHTIPIDFNRQMYEDAREKSGSSDERLFEDYFDAQYEMLRAINPPVVGHFDLIRLLSDNPNLSFRQWEQVWKRIERNLKQVASYGGVLELNSSALRKGLTEPYPQVEICQVCTLFFCDDDASRPLQAFLKLGGRFTLSDDAHATDQVGLNYAKVLSAIKAAGIEHIYFCSPLTSTDAGVEFVSLPVADLADHALWLRRH